MAVKRGVVFLLEDTDYSDGAALLTGTFSGYHDVDEAVGDEIDAAEPEVAIAWGRERADRVWIRLADDDVRYAAGDKHDEGAPRWPPQQVVRRRRRPGEDWRDRVPSDPVIPWFVVIELSPPFALPRADTERVVEQIASRSKARRWGHTTIGVPESGSDSGFAAYVPVASHAPDPLRMALLPAAEPDADFDGYGLTSYYLELHIESPVAEQAMQDAVELCDVPRRWAAVAWTYPLDQHEASAS